MKKEVTVCDAEHCRTLSDRVCPLCEKDFCREHFKPMLFARLCVQKPGLPQPGQAPFAPGQEKFDTHNAFEEQIGICEWCYGDLNLAQYGPEPRSARRDILRPLIRGLRSQMIDACRVALATYKLESSGK
jgi:hypothetical protein